MKSSRGIGSRSSWARRSGVVSIRKYFPFSSIFADCRSRLLRGSSDAQMAQRHPTTGTPVEVPVPRNVTIIGRIRFEVRGSREKVKEPYRTHFPLNLEP